MATGPIGRTPQVGGVRPTREGERGGEREGTGATSRSRDGGRAAGADLSDRVTISPDALRGARGRDGDASGGGGAQDGRGEGAEASGAEAADFRNGGEALLLARGLANALLAEPGRASRLHDAANVARLTSLLRG